LAHPASECPKRFPTKQGRGITAALSPSSRALTEETGFSLKQMGMAWVMIKPFGPNGEFSFAEIPTPTRSCIAHFGVQPDARVRQAQT